MYFESTQYEEALGSFAEGVAIHPDDTELHFNLGATYDKLNRFDDMTKEMALVLELDAEHANAMNYLGIRLNEAVTLIQQALSLKENEGAFIDSLGWAYYKLGRMQEALKELERAIELMPDDPVIQEHLGQVYLAVERSDEAKAAWLKALELDPDNQKLRTRFKEAGFGSVVEELSPPVGEGETRESAVTQPVPGI